MIAEILTINGQYSANMERQIKHSIGKVWGMLTINEELEKWFSELRVGELREGGFMEFRMSATKIEKLEITELMPQFVLAFDWFGDAVRFELKESPDGCLLTFMQVFQENDEQKSKDLAGWHVCLDMIISLLDGRTIDPRKKQWEKWYEAYSKLLSTR